MGGPIVITGGGTGGHVFPGLSLARVLSARGHQVVFVGTQEGPESRLLPVAGFEFRAVPVEPFVRRVSPAALRAPVSSIRASRTCRQYVRGSQAVVGLGGYASVPAILAARRERVPVILHEQNAVAGLANKALARLADVVALGFSDAGASFPRRRVVVTGNPVREEIVAVVANRPALAEEARHRFDLDGDRATVVVFGGSQGALHLDRALVGTAALLASRSDLQVLLIAGAAHEEEMRRALEDAARQRGREGGGLQVRVEGFVDRMDLVYAAADLVVARAGASSIAEVSACGLPAVLVPYPYATAGHQEANARAMQRAGGAIVLPDDELSADSLSERIVGLVDRPDRLEAMGKRSLAFAAPDAAVRLAEVVEDAAR
jgi:UDP-N-acetylglucosamine--N-acetylmuramyl-(pentapeptide) pyrophosphoryl-undecaprenol N-acetylglucosamine transferase